MSHMRTDGKQRRGLPEESGAYAYRYDAMGRALKVQYPDGKEVSYTYGKGGERTGITYPDGRTASYFYDSRLRLAGLKDGEDTIAYEYDERGKLSCKTFPNGMETTCAYDTKGQLMELTHRDKEDILDRYVYGYDLMGNKTSIEKHVKEKLEEWQRNLSELWGKYGEEIIISYALICALALTVATQGAALPASAAAIIVILLINKELVNQTECDVS